MTAFLHTLFVWLLIVVANAATPDLYSYAGGDPINYVDPTGRSFVDIFRQQDQISLNYGPSYSFFKQQEQAWNRSSFDYNYGGTMSYDEMVFESSLNFIWQNTPGLSMIYAGATGGNMGGATLSSMIGFGTGGLGKLASLSSKGYKSYKFANTGYQVSRSSLQSAPRIGRDLTRVGSGMNAQRQYAGYAMPKAGRMPASAHPGALSASYDQVSQASIMRALRQSGTPEALATAKLIKRGRVRTNIVPTDPYGAGAAGRGSYAPGRDIYIATDKNRNAWQAAGIATHETKHILQRVTPQTYNKMYELDAYRWQRDAGFLNMSDGQIKTFINTSPLYKNVPGTLD